MEADTFFPLCCRGLQVIGFPNNSNIYLCVHQLSIELWKAFDTPRVSVQRKMMDMGISIIMADKEMINMLRTSGVIENFRATMILLSDAERLCDALDMSRKKRGLNKHALKRLYLPGERSTRSEEVVAKKFTAKMKRLYDRVPLQPDTRSGEPQDVIHEQTNTVDKWALSGNSPEAAFSDEDYLFDLLLVAEKPSPAGGRSCIEVKPEMLSVETFSRLRSNSKSLSAICQEGVASRGINKADSTSDIRSDHVPTSTKHKHSTKSPRSDKLTDKTAITPLIDIDSPLSLNMSTGAWDGDDLEPLSSPTMISEFEDVHSASSISSSRTSHRSQYASGSNTPERFLFFQNSSGSEADEDSDTDYFPPSHSNGGYSMTLRRSDNSQAMKPQGISKRVVATKLRHFAKTTSPNVSNGKDSVLLDLTLTALTTNTPASNELNTQTPRLTNSGHGGEKGDVLVVKRKRGRPPKHPRATALSTFATKKRAISRSPSPFTDHINEPTIPKKMRLEATKEEYRSKSSSKSETNRVNQLACKPDSADVVNNRRENFTNPGSLRLNLDLYNPTGNHSPILSNGKESFDNASTLCALLSNSTRNYDDDQVSITSSSTNSTNSNQRTSSRLTRKSKSNLDEKECSKSQSLFRFNDLFSFVPPKLVVKEGELVPEHSLSVKKVERNSLSRLPEAHPFLKWSLGRPVTNQSQRTQSRNGRKRKATS